MACLPPPFPFASLGEGDGDDVEVVVVDPDDVVEVCCADTEIAVTAIAIRRRGRFFITSGTVDVLCAR